MSLSHFHVPHITISPTCPPPRSNPEDCVNGVNMLQPGQIIYETQSDEAAQTGAPADLTPVATPAPAPAPQSLRRRIA